MANESAGRVPILRKDFVIDRYQLIEARAFGADAALLIVAALTQSQLEELGAFAAELGLSTLVEIHNEDELARAVAAGAEVIGINNRDLHSFNVDLAVSERLAPRCPADSVVVAESGIFTRSDVERLAKAGASAIWSGSADRGARPSRSFLNRHQCRNHEPARQDLRNPESGTRSVDSTGGRRLKSGSCSRNRSAVLSPRWHAHQSSSAPGESGDADILPLFVDASADEVERIHAQVGFDLAQLHGASALEVAAQLSMLAIISVRVAPDDDRSERAEFAERVAASGAEFVMVDGYHPGMAGGTGVRADWDFAAMLANRVPLMLAGGLDAGNVSEAIAIVRPAVVDVSSGVERAGVKDETLIRSFIDAARAGYAQSISSGTSSQDAP
ncbi:MAG: hypothetical protein R2843_15965 [Thermomicrobiales bacterium]